MKSGTAPIVIRSYSRDKLIATILDWYKKNPHPENPKSTSIRKLLKKELVTQVFHIQDIMWAVIVTDTLPVVSPDANPVPQTQASTLEIEDI